MVASPADDGPLSPGKPLSVAVVVGTTVRIHLQRRVSAGTWYEAPMGSGPAPQRVLEGDLARPAAARRYAVQGGPGDVERRHTPGNQSPRLRRRDTLHHRL